MLDLIQHFLFFNPPQRRSADAALKHVFFSETEEPVHTIVPMDLQPMTPPHITPLDLLTIPDTPYEVCPDWNTEHPVSRYGRLCSAIHKEPIDTFLQSPEPPDENDYVTSSRPIYSSHQKVRPLTGHDSDNRPIYSSHADDLVKPTYVDVEETRPIYSSHSTQSWNPYMYASYRPTTPKVEHVSSSHSHREERPVLDSRRSSTHLLHHHHHPHHNDYYERQHPHQLIKWTPPHFVQHPRYIEQEDVVVRPESRQSTRAETTSAVIPYQPMYTFKPVSQRLNLWVPDTEQEDQEENKDVLQDRYEPCYITMN